MNYYRVTITKTLNSKVLAGMWVEFPSRMKPSPQMIYAAFNEKYGPKTVISLALNTYTVEKLG